MALSPERLTNNAFRVLGLSAAASQSAIEQAARRMRIWNDPARVPPTAWDYPWLGELSRRRNDIEQAVARLSDPRTRVRERLFWFCDAIPSPTSATAVAVDQTLHDLANRTDPAGQHDAALVHYAGAVLLDPAISDAARWQRAVEQVRKLVDHGPFMQYLLDVENSGEFDRRARAEESAEALEELPQLIVANLSGVAEAAMDSEDMSRAMSVTGLLRTIDRSAASKMLDRAEDLIERNCRFIEEDLRRGIRFHHACADDNLTVARGARRQFSKAIQPILKELIKLGDAESHRVQRVGWACARVLSMLGTAWVWGGQFIAAQEAFNQALGYASGTSLERDIQEQINENWPRAQRQRMATMGGGTVEAEGEPVYQATMKDGVVGPSSGKRIVPPQPGKDYQLTYASAGTPRRKKTSSATRWGWLIGVVAVALVRVLMSVDSGPSSSPSYTAPRFTPPSSYRPPVVNNPNATPYGTPGQPRVAPPPYSPYPSNQAPSAFNPNDFTLTPVPPVRPQPQPQPRNPGTWTPPPTPAIPPPSYQRPAPASPPPSGGSPRR